MTIDSVSFLPPGTIESIATRDAVEDTTDKTLALLDAEELEKIRAIVAQECRP